MKSPLKITYLFLFLAGFVINLIGITSTQLYTTLIGFFLVSLLNIILIALFILHILKNDDTQTRKTLIIYLIGLLLMSAVTFFRYLSLQVH
ncbi:hypothetical protein [Shouchella lonarensis]|uniref:Uncharacterized protein n=1 Tax=Shouchella lonarensis TaxID=1464122 RepID=A0A1G6MKL2_9BACI|nr:hypothetical protein [Shouchella lonarensis]SDC56011.1 hypothetical protein SAMN05421737_11057 [Shouchella lonarensis]